MSAKSKIVKFVRDFNERVNVKARRKQAFTRRDDRICGKKLTPEQKEEIKEFWEKISGTKKQYFDFFWYEIYNGVCNDSSKLKYYIPNDFYYCYVDYYFANDHFCRKFDDKTLYELYFPEVKHPETLVKRSGECLLDSNYHIIDMESAIKLCHKAGSIIYKPAVIESGGKNIKFWSVGEDEQILYSLLRSNHFVIQKLLHQHEVLNNIHSSSINTVRVLTLLFDGKVRVMSSILRMGSNGNKVDNGSSGGIFCGIMPDGHLRSVAYDFTGKSFEYYPQGIKFADVTIPSYKKICELATQLAPRLQNITKMISWDFCVGEDGEPILVEANLYYSGCTVLQTSNGPIFGEMTEDVLRYIFKHNPMLRR